MTKLPNVILIGIDNLRFDLLAGHPDTTYLDDFLVGQTKPEIPTLNSIAEECFWFRTCVSSAGYTPPSFATALTGTYPYRHGVAGYRCCELRPEVPTIFELLKAQGYRTVCMGRDPALFTLPAIGRGSDSVVRTEKELFSFLTEDPSHPVMAFIHFFDCHVPFLWTDYDQPDINDDFFEEMEHVFGEDLHRLSDDWKIQVRAQALTHGVLPAGADPDEHYEKLVNLYLKSIAKFDAGRLAHLLNFLRSSGLWDTSYIVFFSDHGEIRNPGQPHLTMHGAHTNESLTRVVLMIHGPDIPSGVSDDLVGLVDLTPTLLDLIGHPATNNIKESFDGRTLVRVIHGKTDRDDHWYMQEGWMVFIDKEIPPVRLERAVRTSDAMRYVFRGDLGDLFAAYGLRGSDLEAWLAHTFIPARLEIASDRKHLTRCLNELGHGPSAAIELILQREVMHPRYAMYDLLSDPYEKYPLRVSFAPELWADYLEKYHWMLAHSAPPATRAEATEVKPETDRSDEIVTEEEELAERLKALGYHD